MTRLENTDQPSTGQAALLMRLGIAVRNNDRTTVLECLAQKVDVNQRINGESTPLCIACRNQHFDIIAMLVTYGADINLANYDGRTPLMESVTAGNDTIFSYLMSRGAQADAADKEGTNVLMWAALNDADVIVARLLEAGADINARDGNGRTALFWAVRNNTVYAAHTLLKAGADPSIAETCGDGESPIHVASAQDCPKLAEALLAHGADVTARTRSGKTALDLADSREVDAILSKEMSRLKLAQDCVENSQNRRTLSSYRSGFKQGGRK